MAGPLREQPRAAIKILLALLLVPAIVATLGRCKVVPKVETSGSSGQGNKSRGAVAELSSLEEGEEEEEEDREPESELNDGCGTWSNGNIHAGNVAKPGSWPWQATLLFKPENLTDNRWQQFCGGTLITRSHVLTAAHCLAGLKPCEIRVRLGNQLFESLRATELRPGDQEVAWTGLHSEYNGTTMRNDIALIRLKRALRDEDKPVTVCLPTSSVENYVGREATIVGHGINGVRGSKQLLEADLVVYDNSRCSSTSRGKGLFESQICAGTDDGSHDSCEGDSGGPLMVREEQEGFVQVGIVSYGTRPCSNRDIPGLYTRTSSYWRWIKKNTRI